MGWIGFSLTAKRAKGGRKQSKGMKKCRFWFPFLPKTSRGWDTLFIYTLMLRWIVQWGDWLGVMIYCWWFQQNMGSQPVLCCFWITISPKTGIEIGPTDEMRKADSSKREKYKPSLHLYAVIILDKIIFQKCDRVFVCVDLLICWASAVVVTIPQEKHHTNCLFNLITEHI